MVATMIASCAQIFNTTDLTTIPTILLTYRISQDVDNLLVQETVYVIVIPWKKRSHIGLLSKMVTPPCLVTP